MGKSARERGREERRRQQPDRRTGIDRRQEPPEDHPLHRLVNAPTALARLHALREVRGWLDELERGSVRELRAVGVPWATLGSALGVTGQAVSKRYGGAQ